MSESNGAPWSELIGEVIVLDLSSPYVCLGRLVARREGFLKLADADLHDLRDAQSTREKYVLDVRRYGLHPNREAVWVNLREIVGISRLADVVAELRSETGASES